MALTFKLDVRKSGTLACSPWHVGRDFSWGTEDGVLAWDVVALGGFRARRTGHQKHKIVTKASASSLS